MKKCPFCRAENAKEAVVCRNCKAALQKPEAPAKSEKPKKPEKGKE